MVVPESARRLTQTIAAYAGSAGPPRQASPMPNQGMPIQDLNPLEPADTVAQYGATESDVLREQLSQLAPELYDLLDQQWSQYLALPSALFLQDRHPTPAELQQAVGHFDRVANDPQFRQLAGRPEFQSVYGVLKHYQQSLSANETTLQLPPPPPLEAVPR